MTYEKKVIRELRHRQLGDLEYHQWIEFYDRNGQGYCEPEAFIEFTSRVLLIEIKLTGIPGGRDQMGELYAPLLHLLLGKPIQMLQICKWTTDKTPGPFVNSIEEFLQTDLPYATWQLLL